MMRPSTEMRIESVGMFVARLVIGGVIMGAGMAIGFFDYAASLAAHERLHIGHTSLCVGTVIFGAWVALPKYVEPPIRVLWVYIGQTSLPFVGGRRKDDPPAPPKDAP